MRDLRQDELECVFGGWGSNDPRDPDKQAQIQRDIIVLARSRGQAKVSFGAPAILVTGSIPNIPFKTIPGEGTSSQALLPKGTVVQGTDNDGNGIPDLVDDLIKTGNLKFVHR